MARIPINRSCNIVTGKHSEAYRSPATPDEVSPQITVPRLRARLSVEDAAKLAEDLAEAVAFVRTGLSEAVVAVHGRKVS